MTNLSDNLHRLLGMHRCTQGRAAELIGVSRQTTANWAIGSREPSLQTMIKLAEVFEVDPVRLVQEPFEDLLSELLDRERFLRVEARIHGGPLLQELKGPTDKVVPLHQED